MRGCSQTRLTNWTSCTESSIRWLTAKGCVSSARSPMARPRRHRTEALLGIRTKIAPKRLLFLPRCTFALTKLCSRSIATGTTITNAMLVANGEAFCFHDIDLTQMHTLDRDKVAPTLARKSYHVTIPHMIGLTGARCTV